MGEKKKKKQKWHCESKVPKIAPEGEAAAKGRRLGLAHLVLRVQLVARFECFIVCVYLILSLLPDTHVSIPSRGGEEWKEEVEEVVSLSLLLL